MVVLRVYDGIRTLSLGSCPVADAHWLANCLAMHHCLGVIDVCIET